MQNGHASPERPLTMATADIVAVSPSKIQHAPPGAHLSKKWANKQVAFHLMPLHHWQSAGELKFFTGTIAVPSIDNASCLLARSLQQMIYCIGVCCNNDCVLAG